MSDGIVKAKLGGKDYLLRAELNLAPMLEAKTGKGIFLLAREIANLSSPTSDVVAVISETLAANKTHMDADEIYAAMQVEGLPSAYALATAILFALVKPPKPDKKSKNGAAATAPN